MYTLLFFVWNIKVKPGEIDKELRIYQNNEILYHKPTTEELLKTMDEIVRKSEFLDKVSEGVY